MACVACGHVVPVTAADDFDVDVRVQVRELIQQLSSDTRQARIKAERGLVSLGPAALPYLPSPDLLPSVSVRQAVRRVRVTLERQASEESVRASTVSLTGEHPLSRVLSEIETQTSNQIVPRDMTDEQLSQPVSLKWEQRPFWSAIADLEQQGFATSFDNSGRFVLQPASASGSTAEVIAHEAYRIEAGPLSVRSFGTDDEFVFKCPLTIECEPRLRPLFFRMNTSFFTLERADGTKLDTFNPDGRISVPLGVGGRTAKTELVFVSDRPDGGPFKLTGLATLLTAALEQPIVFRDFAGASGVARRRGGVTVVLVKSDVVPIAEQHRRRVEIRVSYDAGANAFESHQTWIFHNRVYLQRPEEEPIEPQGFETLFQGDGSVGVEYQFVDTGRDTDDMSFTYMAPTLLIDVPLKFAIEELTIRD